MGAQVDAEPCPRCRTSGRDKSGDNLKVFSDGGKYCFACEYTEHPDKEREPIRVAKPVGNEIPVQTDLTYEALPHRNISRETCKLYGYGTKTDKDGQKWEIAPFHDDQGVLTSQKLRHFGTHRSKGENVSKVLRSTGVGSGRGLYGRHLVSHGGPVLVITEGELDAMSVYEANGRKYPATSVPDGVSNAHKVIANDLEYVNSFGRVVFMFDQDEPGQTAAEKCAAILRPGKAYIAKLPMKDASECVVNNQKAAVQKAIWNAEPYRPDGIVHIKDVEIDGTSKATKIYTFPDSAITKATYGRRAGDILMLTSGSGMGKSTFCTEMMKHDLDKGLCVGALMLEETTAKTKQNLMSVYLQKPIHKILASRQINRELEANKIEPIDFGQLPELSDAELADGKAWIDDKNFFVYDHFGSLETDVLTKRIEYLHYGCGCEVVYLDHVSIVVSGNDGDERRELDKIMTTLKSLAERTGVSLTTVCHLTKPNGQPFEEGGQISLRDLRGSGALYQLADTVLGFERHQQHSDHQFANTMGIRLLKDRFGGNTGLKAAMRFDADTQTLTSADLDWYKGKLNEKDG